MEITELLFARRDDGYADFQSRIAPTVPRERFIGVRVPELRKLAKDYRQHPEYPAFLAALPHRYFDENLLHAILLSGIREFDSALSQVEAFLPFVDNWTVCDTLSPLCFKKHKAELLPKIREWCASPLEYTCRFGMEILMNHYLDADFQPEYLEIPASVRREEYYVRMMQAWFYATALARQWDAALPYLTETRLDDWVHNKTVQKARESFRISDERKALLLGLKK